MNIILLHGDNTQESYARLTSFMDSAKGRGWEVVNLNGKSVKSLADELTAQSLFTETNLYILKNSPRLKKPDLAFLATDSKKLAGTLVIYHETTLPASVKKSVPKGFKEEKYDIPPTIWKFLDAFYPGNIKTCLTLLHKTLETEATEFVFAMLARHVRDLYQVRVDPESMTGPAWRIAKLRSQANKFEDDTLPAIIEKMAVMDVDSKTSKAKLADSLDMMIAIDLE